MRAIAEKNMSSHRFLFYVPDADIGSDIVTLAGEEHHHLTRVLRFKPGDEIHVTNGKGTIFDCRVEKIETAVTSGRVVSSVSEPATRRRCVLALAVLRREKFERATEQCVELGIDKCLPFVAKRSPLKSYSDHFIDRLRRIAVSSMKQSFRSVLPQIESPVGFDDMLSLAGAGGAVVVGCQSGVSLSLLERTKHVTVVVGPEAGFTDDERRKLKEAGGVFVSVSRHRLRSETAAVAIVSAIEQLD